MKSNHAFDEIQVTVIYSHALLVAMMSECYVKRVICKTWAGLRAETFARSEAAEHSICSGSAPLASITGC